MFCVVYRAYRFVNNLAPKIYNLYTRGFNSFDEAVEWVRKDQMKAKEFEENNNSVIEYLDGSLDENDGTNAFATVGILIENDKGNKEETVIRWDIAPLIIES